MVGQTCLFFKKASRLRISVGYDKQTASSFESHVGRRNNMRR